MLHHPRNPEVGRLFAWKPGLAQITALVRLRSTLHSQEPTVISWLASLFQGQPSEARKGCLLCARTFAQSRDLFQHLVQQHGEQCA